MFKWCRDSAGERQRYSQGPGNIPALRLCYPPPPHPWLLQSPNLRATALLSQTNWWKVRRIRMFIDTCNAKITILHLEQCCIIKMITFPPNCTILQNSGRKWKERKVCWSCCINIYFHFLINSIFKWLTFLKLDILT